MAHPTALGKFFSLLALTFLLVLTGCGEFDSAFQFGDDSWRGSNEMFTASVAGSVGDGPIANARLRVFSNAGELLLEADSNDTADFELTVQARGLDFPLTIRADEGTDLVTNAAPDFGLVSVIMQPGEREIANLTPYSTLIVNAAEKSGGIDEKTIAEATEAVLSRYGFGLDAGLIPDPLFTPMDEDNVHAMVKASETMGEMIRRTRDAMITAGTYVDGNDIVAALAADLTDGWIDGRGAEGHDARIAAVANVASGAVMLEAMANRLHVYGVDATAAMDNAIRHVRPSAPARSNTRNVPIPAEALDQSLRSLRAVKVVKNDARISEIYDLVAGAEPGVTEFDALSSGIQTMSSGFHNPLNDATLAVAYISDDAELAKLNGASRSGTSSDSDASNEDGLNDGDDTTTDPTTDGDTKDDGETSSTDGGETTTAPITDGDTKDGGENSTTDGDTTTDPQPNDDQQVQEDASETLWSNDGWLQFDGVNDELNTGLSLTHLSAGSFTFEAVLQYTGTESRTWSPVFGSSSETSGGGQILNVGKSSGTFDIHIRLGGLAYMEIKDTQLFDGTQRHLAVVFDQPASEIRVYVDTQLMHRQNVVTEALTSTTSAMMLGAVGHSATERWKGWIGPNRVSNQALEPEQFLGSGSEPVDPRPNKAPTIADAPSTALVVGNPWSFTPKASDPDGDALTFSIENQPKWAEFDKETGRLRGTPHQAGRYSFITITVEDTHGASASLDPFTLQVDEPTLGTATVSWEPPTTRTDGSPLPSSELAGYRVYWGTNRHALDRMEPIDNPGVLTQHIDNLEKGTWYFAVTALDSDGLESPKSEVGSKEIM